MKGSIILDFTENNSVHFFLNCHTAPAWCSKIVKVVLSKEADCLLAKPDMRPWEIERGVSKREEREDFDIQAVFANAEGNTAAII